MGRRIRFFEPDVVYSAVIRCNDQQFFLKPDHDPKHPLLVKGCPVRSFNNDNDLTPEPSVINVIGAAVARAQLLDPIRIHWVEANINHLMIGFSAAAEQLENIPRFFRNVNSAIAVKLNDKWNHNGHLWSSPYRATVCKDDQGVEQQLVYCVTNPVKDDLVETVQESPFFTSFRALAQGEKMSFFRIDWKAYRLAGSVRKKSHKPKDYLEWLELELLPIPGQEDWPAHKRQAWVRAQVRAVEAATKEELRAAKRKAMGRAAQFAADPRDRPKNPKRSGPQPLCHASDPEVAREYEKQWREVVREHRAASIDYLQGMRDREFPEGTFRPPIIKLCSSLKL
jgi:hypothetical protein